MKFSEALSSMWKKIFDYKGTAGKREYWLPYLLHVPLAEAAVILLLLSRLCGILFLIPCALITLYLTGALIARISLTVRRLHDTGKDGWWTLLLLLVGIGTAVVLYLCSLSAVSGYFPFRNIPAPVYGPPEWFDPANNQNEDVYGPPEWYDPSDNRNTEAYGAPDWFDDREDPEPYDPKDNLPQTEYGVPEWEDSEYKPEDNRPVTVYGPPEWFEKDRSGDPAEDVQPVDPVIPADPDAPVSNDAGEAQTTELQAGGAEPYEGEGSSFIPILPDGQQEDGYSGSIDPIAPTPAQPPVEYGEAKPDIMEVPPTAVEAPDAEVLE